MTTKICKGIDYLHIASTNLDCRARWYSYIGGLNLGLAEMLSVLVLALEVMNEEAQPLGLTINWAKTKIQTTDKV